MSTSYCTVQQPPQNLSQLSFTQPPLSPQWNSTPTALFNRVCSYITSPMFDTLVRIAAVCRQWARMLEGNVSGHLDCWRHVPAMSVALMSDHIRVYSCGSHLPGRKVELPHCRSVLRCLRRVRSLAIDIDNESASAIAHFLNLLLAEAADSSTSSCSRVPQLEHLAIGDGSGYRCMQQLRSALSQCVMHCPSLRSVQMAVALLPSAAALRRLCCGGRLKHLELGQHALSAMVWADSLDVVGPWMGASGLQSLVFKSALRLDFQIEAVCLALPALTHLHLASGYADDALQYVGQRMIERLTYLGLGEVCDPLPQSLAERCSALQSLHISIYSRMPGVLDLSHFLPLHLLPRLSELTFLDRRNMKYGDTFIRSPLPATLTYLQLVTSNNPFVTADVEWNEVYNTLPPSLLCLSLTLPFSLINIDLLSRLPKRCPLLTLCHVGDLDRREDEGADAKAQRAQSLQTLRDQLGAPVWCDNVEIVEQQRLDRRWQREAGVQRLGN